ncbi:OmpA2 [Desulfamplus magnetovallimortis]|uniref:OmpA2 n=1 Tax=Desulfamplus magnetovallimortis TaxID=1246637 RepID=A0A1W1HF18_9BACT|nr:OmpA family protein [Desulfamplus magnetovallimortis]SLM31101.1 OmpA2 [Desulfamplus magnetovallimortis]
MKRFIGAVFFITTVAMVMVGCAGQGPKQPLPEFSPQQFDMSMYRSAYDNVLIILDGSSSMKEQCNGNEKFEVAMEVVARMNQTLPEMGQTAGLRTFGHHPSITKKPTVMQYGMEAYTTKGLADGLSKLGAPGGTSPLCMALKAAAGDLEGLSGSTAVVIVSDGKDMPGKTVDAAKALKDKYSSSVICIYPVVVGNDAAGMAIMKQISKVGECGFLSEAANILSSAGMANFVKDVFLEDAPRPAPVKVRLDSDGDGVYDEDDKCPDTPAGVKVDADGCPLDTDGDGVPDYLDKCPGTPAGAKVNPMGCWVLGDLLFDFDKAVIKPAGYPDLAKVIEVLNQNPNMKVVLQGHTDSIGSDAYNKGLSLRRAKAVKAYLVKKGISEGRLKCEAFGESKPAASNKTEFGRSLNRRVQLMPVL